MAKRKRLPPKFFKILLDPSAPHLPLPSTFVSKHLVNKIPENPILQSSNGGFSWQLKIKQIDGDYCFADGWINVVKDIQLCYGDFLVFQLVDPSTFSVSIFSPNGCEQDLKSKIQAHGKDVHEEEDDDDEEEDDDDDDDDYGVVPVKNVNNNDADAADDDDDDEDEEEEDGGCDEEEEEDDEYDEEVEEDDGDGDIDGHDGDPFFMTVISKTHQQLLRLPAEFMRLTGIDGERRIIMKNPDDKEWDMSLRLEGSQYPRYYLSSGWKDFLRGNELSEGDKCVFKFIKTEDKLCLARVTRKKARSVARDPPPAATKRKRGLPPGEYKVKQEDGDVAKDSQPDAAKRKRGTLPGEQKVKQEDGDVAKDSQPDAAKESQPDAAKRKRGTLPGEHKVKQEDDSAEVAKRPRGLPLRQKSRVVYF